MAKHQRRNRKQPNLRKKKHRKRQQPIIPVSIEKVGEEVVAYGAPYDPNRVDEYRMSFFNSLKVLADEYPGLEHLSKELALEEEGRKRLEQAPHRLKELEEEYRESFEKIISRYSLSASEREDLKHGLELGLEFIAMYEDATPEELKALRECQLNIYASESLSDYIDFELSEAFWRASFDLQNALGLGTVTIDVKGSINGETFSY